MKNLLKQLLLNLVVNACEAIGENTGVVNFKVVMSEKTKNVDLLVEDNGPGIDKIHIKNIYQPFYSTKKEGTGLGLAIVHRICTALGVAMHVNTKVGEGTSFKIEFHKFQPQSHETTNVEEQVV